MSNSIKFSLESNENYNDILKILTSDINLPIQTKGMLTEVLSNILIGSRKLRQGSKPMTFFVHKMNLLIEESIKNNLPIPIGIPMGPKKPGISIENVDLAELWTLKTLGCINEKVKTHYPQGIEVIFFVEDWSAFIFESEIGDDRLVDVTSTYIDQFERLIHVLDLPFIKIFRESEKVISLHDFQEKKRENLPLFLELMFEYMGEGKVSSLITQELKELGWRGEFAPETIEYYRAQYERNYPHLLPEEVFRKIAEYHAVALSRVQLGMRKVDREYIPASFAKLIPGVEPTMQQKLFYRSVPMDMNKMHTPFWRAKGYLIEKEGELKTCVEPWNATVRREFSRQVVALSRGGYSAKVNMDILI